MKIKLEEELEGMAGDLTSLERRMLAAKFSRWVRQLRVTANAMDLRVHGPRRRMRFVSLTQSRLN